MERLSGLDASFLYIESPTQPLHVCSILELDTSTVPGGYTSVGCVRMHALAPMSPQPQGPARAINCARAIRDALRDRGLTIRAGLHTGEVEMADGDVHGIAVHIAARIIALAAPDEVLVSGVIPPLVLGSRISFVYRGSHELKGVPERWPVFAVRDGRTDADEGQSNRRRLALEAAPRKG